MLGSTNKPDKKREEQPTWLQEQRPGCHIYPVAGNTAAGRGLIDYNIPKTHTHLREGLRTVSIAQLVIFPVTSWNGLPCEAEDGGHQRPKRGEVTT